MNRIVTRTLAGLRSVALLSLPLVILLILLQGIFSLLIWIESVPRLNFDIYQQSLARLGQAEIPDSDIVVPPPTSLSRKYSMAAAKQVDEVGNTVSIYHGFRRATPFEREKPAGYRRVLVIGDSFAWGFRLADDETFAHHLEEGLRTRPIPGVEKVEVLNAGIIASTITHSHESLRYNDVEFDPDVVILNFCDNDISDLTVDRSISPFMYDLMKQSAWIAPVRYIVVKSILNRQRRVLEAVAKNEGLELTEGRFGVKPWVTHIDWPADMESFIKNSDKISQSDITKLLTLYYYTEPSMIMPYTREDDEFVAELWQRWEKNLIEIRDLGREKNFELIVNVYPIFARIYETQFDERATPENIIREICERNGIRFVDVLDQFRAAEPALRRQGRSFYQLPEDSHPSPHGQAIVAAALEREVREILK
ncbi:MAG: SGNH/GDSL hydrolase family protein [bacterium]|nr:SGNH/GDSL hydrolase family protein [bacterium]